MLKFHYLYVLLAIVSHYQVDSEHGARRKRIAGGTQAAVGSHPGIVSIQFWSFHYCGGALLPIDGRNQTDIIITAAHCVLHNNASDIHVRIGAYDLNDVWEGEVLADVALLLPHQQYNASTKLNDLGIIKLKRPVSYSETIQPIQLPSPNDTVQENMTGIVAGWGIMHEGQLFAEHVLHQVEVPVLNMEQCIDAYNDTIKISPQEMFCAGFIEGNMDACKGDSGGPLVFPSKLGGGVLQGVVSIGLGCGRPGKPGVYTRITNYINWINEQVNAHSSLINHNE